jgi:hypothetical protein
MAPPSGNDSESVVLRDERLVVAEILAPHLKAALAGAAGKTRSPE